MITPTKLSSVAMGANDRSKDVLLELNIQRQRFQRDVLILALLMGVKEVCRMGPLSYVYAGRAGEASLNEETSSVSLELHFIVERDLTHQRSI